MNQINTTNLLPVGRTGEPAGHLYCRQGRRIRSTCLSERKPAMVALGREFSAKTGKGSKRMHSVEGIPYLESLRRSVGVSDEAISCVKRLQTVWKLYQDNRRAKDLFRLLKREELWIAAYKKLAHNKGRKNLAGGAGGTISGTSMKALMHLRDLVSSENYTAGAASRACTLKPKKRSLGIAELRGRLVQEVLKTLLECVYEPRFYECSHGFRPQRSQHTCLRQIRRDFGSAKWVIEGDISKCLGTIEHHVVRKCLSRTIDDRAFVNFVIRGVRSKVLMSKNALEWRDTGTYQRGMLCPLQGGVLCPLLNNIVLHQLDRYILRLKRKIDDDNGLQRRKNPPEKPTGLMNKRRNYRGTKAGRRTAAALREARKATSVLPDGPNYRQLHYTRYANHFIVGVTGPRELAVRVKALIARYLKRVLHLQINEEKTKITQLSKRGVPFLGYIIRRGSRIATKHAQNDKKYLSIRRVKGGITLLADVDKVLRSLAHKGFCKGSQPVPNFRYMHQPQSNTVTMANSMLRGLSQFYRLSENRRAAVSYFSYLIRYSIAKMFAAKYKLRSLSRVFKKAGKDLGKPLKLGKSTLKFKADDGKLVKGAKIGGTTVPGSMPRLLFVKYKNIPKPDVKPLAKPWDPWKETKQGRIAWPIIK